MREAWSWMRWGVCAVLVGCGATREEPVPESPPERSVPTPDTPVPAEPPASTPPTGEAPPAPGESPSTEPEAPSPVPTVPVVQPSPSPGYVPPVSAGLEGRPTLAPVACVLWKGAVPPVRATACEGTSVFADGRREVARYDADSRLLERRVYKRNGILEEVESHVWLNGREQSRRIDRPDAGTYQVTQWEYDAQGRIAWRSDYASSTVPVGYEYVRDANGRLQRIERRDGRAPILYQYNEAGQLVGIDSRPDCDMDVARCETFTYWPNGQVRENSWDNGDVDRITHLYDDRGNLVDEMQYGFEFSRHTFNSYNAARKVFRVWEKKGVYVYDHELVRDFYYDASGLLLMERLGKVYTQPRGGEPGLPRVTTYLNTTRRLTYLCGTAIVWLDEWDSDMDGKVDARRTHERDAQGRLVHEEYSGTPGMDDGPVSRDFKYSCD
ncbi:hypothetical protein [Melittangium boletus]|uniref:hypothetical protein n=1 Tax=Melittangium boletus TaxID=83453 RepID=UPI003DA6AD26